MSQDAVVNALMLAAPGASNLDAAAGGAAPGVSAGATAGASIEQ
jgi:hypothetical protein